MPERGHPERIMLGRNTGAGGANIGAEPSMSTNGGEKGLLEQGKGDIVAACDP